MPKLIEMKKSDFLKKARNYVLKKKESPTKLYMTPEALSVVKIKLMFVKPHEMVFKSSELLFFKKTLGKMSKVKPTDADAGKTYYFSFFAPLLQELAVERIYVGKSSEEKLEALSVYLNALKDDKIIFEVFSGADLKAADIIAKGHEEGEKPHFTAEETSHSESIIEGSASDLFAPKILEREGVSPALLEEQRKRAAEQEFIIKELGDKIEAYENLARQTDLKIRKNAVDLQETRLEAEKSDLKIETLRQALQNLQAENVRLKTLQAAAEEKIKKEKAKEEKFKKEEKIKEKAKTDAPPGNKGNPDRADPEDEVYGNEMNELIAALDDQEINASLHLSEVIAQWASNLRHSRAESISASIYNPRHSRNETQTLKRFAAIAALEQEKAAHFAASDKFWPKEEELAAIKSKGYDFDRACFSFYQDFPKELKEFAILFAFWEAAHHNRFYRNALSAVLNGGAVPAALGMGDADQTDILLRLLHYADMTRILMGHYHSIAQSQFGIDLFIAQEENNARFQASLLGNAKGNPVDISRTTIEAALFI